MEKRGGEAQKKYPSPFLALLFSSPLLSPPRDAILVRAPFLFLLPDSCQLGIRNSRYATPPGGSEDHHPSIHPFFAPRKANDLLFSWLGPTLRGRITHDTLGSRCTHVYTRHLLFIRETLFSIFLSFFTLPFLAR